MLYDVNTGEFTYTIESPKLSMGLRSSKRNKRNDGGLLECQGAVGLDGVLQSIERYSRIDTSLISDGFPYPQLFVLTNLIIICGQTNIYEYYDGGLHRKFIAPAGDPWDVVDFYEYVYLTNNVCAVVRSSEDKSYSLSSDLPYGTSLCNFNGQVIVSSPNV